MRTDTEIRNAGLQALVTALGPVEAEKFVSLMLREPCDYTQWQRELWDEKTVEEISGEAMRGRGASTDS